MDTNALTISSLEIAELTGSDKDNVKLTMEGLSEKGLITFTATQEPPVGEGKLMNYPKVQICALLY